MKTRAKRTKAVAGKKGGTVRAERMSAKERSESARRAAQARWWTAKQEVLQRYPQAVCLRIEEPKTSAAARSVYAYQIAILINDTIDPRNNTFEALWSGFATPNMAWEMTWDYVRTKGERR